jgi:hypothetical protein
MKDKTADGTEEGRFRVGDVVRYDLSVLSDQSRGKLPPLKVLFTLPPEMEFVGGEGEEGVSISGAGRAAQSTPFQVPIDGTIVLQVRVRVVGVPAGNLAQFSASVQTADGVELTVESESTTLSPSTGGQ